MIDLLAVPFSYNYLRKGDFASFAVKGLLRTEPDAVVLEFRVKPMVVVDPEMTGDGRVHTLRLPYADIQSATFRRRFFLPSQIVLRTRTLRALEGLPNVEGIEAVLPVAYRDRALAREVALTIDDECAEDRLRALGVPTERPSLPPG